MSTKKIHLASGHSDFIDIRTKGLLYIDKTKYIHNLISDIEYKYWFLARPRRFGKTMFIDTLEHFFLGNEELFRGLYIHSKGYEFIKTPVIRLDMSIGSGNIDILNTNILESIEDVAKRYDLPLRSQSPSSALKRLIFDLEEKYNQPVVVLIDEYDTPILNHINKTELAKEIRETLREFYVTLKSVEKSLRFVFVTGISKFGKTAIHSALNNLNDITHDDNYAGICGYTEKELIDNFSPLFNGLINSLTPSGIFNGEDNNKFLINSILDKYNGYSWNGSTRILNPYSINNCFSKQKLDNFWLQTGPPLLLEHAMSQNPTAYLQSNWGKLTAADVDKTDIGDLRPVSVLFQTGYLTIDTATTKYKNTSKLDGSKSTKSITYYTLKIPNDEVLDSYKSALFKNLFPLLSDEDKIISCHDDIAKSINEENAVKLTEILQDHLVCLPYTQHADRVKMSNQEPKLGEFFFQAVFLSFFLGLGLRVIPEPMSSQGRSDIDIFLPNDVYAVLELKYIPNESGTKELPINIDIDMDKKADEAIAQAFRTLQDKKYKNRASKVITAGIVIYDRNKVLVKFAGK